jgi:hypothetical protein
MNGVFTRQTIVNSRASITVLALALFGVSVVSAQSQPRRPQAYEVFDAVLDSLYKSHGDRPSIVLIADSLFAREGGISYGGKFLPPRQSVISLSTIDSFERVTSITIPFPRDYRYKGKFHVLSSLEFAELQARGNEIYLTTPQHHLREMPYWYAFTEKFPSAWGVTVLSQPGFNTDSTEALIYVRHQCGGGCYSSEVVLLDRRRSGWRIADRIDAGSKEGLAVGSLRYLGPGAHFIADRRRQADSTRWAEADSVRRDRAPRRIRGTVYNRATGTPLAGAQIFARSSAPFPTGTIQRAVADSRGRYEVVNPPIGSMMLEVQCPGRAHRVGATLDAPGMYVFPMLDTIIDVGPPNIEPCWWPRHVHRIASGELESRFLTPPFHPTDAEAQIYAAIIDELKLDTNHLLMSERTAAWCDWRFDCPTLSLAHLIRSGQVDSTTLTSFRRAAQDSVALNPRRIAQFGGRILTEGERAYIRYEAGRLREFGGVSSEGVTEWAIVRQLYGTDSVVAFTRVGFNDSGNQAIVAFRLTGAQDRESETFLMKRAGAVWKVAVRHLESQRPGAEFVEDRCVAIASTGKPTAAQMQSIAGDYDFTLVASSNGDPTMPWRMRFARDSTNTIVFEVLDPQSGKRLREREPGTHVGGGDVSFRNAAGLLQFDGSGLSLRVDRIESGMLFGFWERHAFGIRIRDGKALPEPSGHFCAVRR